MRLGKKILLTLLSAALLVFLIYQGFILIHYRLYDGYKQYLSDRDRSYETGSPFAPLAAADGGKVPGMELAAQTDDFQLYVDTTTTNIAVYDKRTGKITYACPPGADDDPVASNPVKTMMKSCLTVDFFNTKRISGRYNTYDMSVVNGQFEIESLKNGLRVRYDMGDKSSSTGIVPVYIHQDRLAFFLDKIEDPIERSYVESRYFPSASAPEGFLELIEGARKGAATIRRMTEYLTKAGYTEEDLISDLTDSGVEGAVPIGFEITIEYRLDGDSLVVTVPTSQIVEKSGAMIDKIHVLKYFGAADTGEEGYFLVPSGSGSLIYFNNGKSYVEDYGQYVYGLDPLSFDYTVLGNAEMARLPVFGIQKEGYGILAQIGEGQSFAQINAVVSGKYNSYNNANATFIVRGTNALTMFGITGLEAEMPIIEKDIYDADLTVRYSFLTEEYNGYSGMASYYRERLAEEGVLGEPAEQGDIPMYIDMIGAVTGTKFALSVQYDGIIPMTKYKQAGEIIDSFAAAGITNQIVNYQGWFNRGYYHDVPDKIGLVRQLGSKKDLEELSAKLEAQGGKLYTDVAIQEVTFQSRRFRYELESSRYYGGDMVAWQGQVNPTTYTATYSLGYGETAFDFLSPKFLPRYIDSLIKNLNKYNVTGLSLRDLGSTLQSDRKRNEFIDREQALSIVSAQLSRLAEMDKDIMVSGGNLYAFPVSDDLLNVPLTHNDYYIADEEVPFYQMLVHGYIPYAGYAFNRSDAFDASTIALKLLEYGASPHFTLTYEEASEIKYTGLNRMYGTYYQNWVGFASELYNTVNPILSKVSGCVMLRHEVTDEGLRCVTYDNGTQILINYTDAELSYKGTSVPAAGFAVREEAVS